MSLQPARAPRHARPTDAELLEAVAGGSDAAFEELRSRYRNAIDRTCRALLRRDAEDCAQEAFLRIWQKARLYDARRGSAASWVLTVTRSVAYNLSAKAPPEPQPPPGDEATTDADAVDAVWLDAALGRLSPRERAVIELAYFADLSQAEIAQRLGVPLGTVKSWTRRGLNRLAALLEEEART